MDGEYLNGEMSDEIQRIINSKEGTEDYWIGKGVRLYCLSDVHKFNIAHYLYYFLWLRQIFTRRR